MQAEVSGTDPTVRDLPGPSLSSTNRNPLTHGRRVCILLAPRWHSYIADGIASILAHMCSFNLPMVSCSLQGGPEPRVGQQLLCCFSRSRGGALLLPGSSLVPWACLCLLLLPGTPTHACVPALAYRRGGWKTRLGLRPNSTHIPGRAGQGGRRMDTSISDRKPECPSMWAMGGQEDSGDGKCSPFALVSMATVQAGNQSDLRQESLVRARRGFCSGAGLPPPPPSPIAIVPRGPALWRLALRSPVHDATNSVCPAFWAGRRPWSCSGIERPGWPTSGTGSCPQLGESRSLFCCMVAIRHPRRLGGWG